LEPTQQDHWLLASAIWHLFEEPSGKNLGKGVRLAAMQLKGVRLTAVQLGARHTMRQQALSQEKRVTDEVFERAVLLLLAEGVLMVETSEVMAGMHPKAYLRRNYTREQAGPPPTPWMRAPRRRPGGAGSDDSASPLVFSFGIGLFLPHRNISSSVAGPISLKAGSMTPLCLYLALSRPDPAPLYTPFQGLGNPNPNPNPKKTLTLTLTLTLRRP
jgi:hypothetical protein